MEEGEGCGHEEPMIIYYIYIWLHKVREVTITLL